jgi:hypothetical protein
MAMGENAIMSVPMSMGSCFIGKLKGRGWSGTQKENPGKEVDRRPRP